MAQLPIRHRIEKRRTDQTQRLERLVEREGIEPSTPAL
jgi:hypothetical protein